MFIMYEIRGQNDPPAPWVATLVRPCQDGIIFETFRSTSVFTYRVLQVVFQILMPLCSK